MFQNKAETKLFFSKYRHVSKLFGIHDLCSIIWAYGSTIDFEIISSKTCENYSTFRFVDDNLLVSDSTSDSYGNQSLVVRVIDGNSIETKEMKENANGPFSRRLVFKKDYRTWPTFDLCGTELLIKYGNYNRNWYPEVHSVSWPQFTVTPIWNLGGLSRDNCAFVHIDATNYYVLNDIGKGLIYDIKTKWLKNSFELPLLSNRRYLEYQPNRYLDFHICTESNQFLLQTYDKIYVFRYQWVSSTFTVKFQYEISKTQVSLLKIPFCFDFRSSSLLFATKSTSGTTIHFYNLETGVFQESGNVWCSRLSNIAYSSKLGLLVADDQNFGSREVYRVGRSIS